MKKREFPLTIIKLFDENHIKYNHLNYGVEISMDDFVKKLNTSHGSIIKTLIIKTMTGYVSVALSGDRRLSMKKLALVLHLSKNSISFLSKDDFESVVGVPIGATPPLGLDLPLIIDKNLIDQDVVYFSGGTLIDMIGIKTVDFMKFPNGVVGDITE